MFKQIYVYRVQFGSNENSHTSELIAVANLTQLEDAIAERQSNLKSSIINETIIKIECL